MAQNSSFIEKYLQDISYDDDNIFIHDNPVTVNPAMYWQYAAGIYPFPPSTPVMSDEEKKEKDVALKKKWDEYKKIDQPKDLKIKLFPHQLVSVYNMELLERTRKIKISPSQFYMTDFGILGDMPGFGKCCGFDTPLVLYSGEIKMVQNVKVGDLLMGDDSTPRKVLSLARGREEMFKIKQKSGGEDYTVNKSHILSLKMSVKTLFSRSERRIQVFYFIPEEVRYGSKTFSFVNYESVEKTEEVARNFQESLNINPYIDIELTKYMKLPKRIKSKLLGYRVGVEFQEKDIEIDPYFVGLWLGDGNSNGTSITNIDREIIDYLYDEFPDFDIENKDKFHYRLFPKINRHKHGNNRILNFLKSNSLINNKHIPFDYKVNSRSNRLKLLAGLIDSDGYYKNGCYEIIQKNSTLADDIVFLCRSLGFRTTVKKVKKSCPYKGEKREGEYNRISFSGFRIDQIPCLLERKKAKDYFPNKDQMCGEIEVEPMGVDDYYGFVIDGNHRFLLDDFTVTHNTYSIISLLLRDKMSWDVSKEHSTTIVNSYGESLKMITNNTKKRVRPSLILASSNLIEQWKEYFSFVKTGKITVKEISLNAHMEDLDLSEWDVLLVNSTRYNELMDKVGTNVVWKRFIFDDAASTPIPAMRHINAGFIWFVSATYQGLLYLRGKGYMRDFFKTFGYDTLSNLVIKNSDEFCRYSFKMPDVIEVKHKCINPRILGVLGDHIDSEVRLMISAGDIKGAIAKLGGGFSNDGNLVEIVSKRHKEKLANAKHSLEFWSGRQHAEKEVEIWTKKVKELEDIIADLDKKYKDLLSDDCNICYSSISDPLLTSCCQNIFCGSCIMTWLEKNKTCPLCRSIINVKELVYINKGDQDLEEKKESGIEKKEEVLLQKHEKILELVKSGLPDKKFLIFSSYDESFNIIRRIFADNSIDYIEMSGTKASRDLKLRKFHTGKVNVIFLNSRFSGAGLNMQEATDIIFYHDMEPHLREQNVGRALRIGREAPLTIHNLVF